MSECHNVLPVYLAKNLKEAEIKHRKEKIYCAKILTRKLRMILLLSMIDEKKIILDLFFASDVNKRKHF